MTSPLIIGIGYKKYSGKDTLASLIKEQLGDACEILHFADALYEEVSSITGVSVEDMKRNKDVFRPMLQWWGTEFRRRYQGYDNYWISRLNDRIYANSQKKLILIPDVRFPNEAEFISAKGGLLIRIDRNLQAIDSHASEVSLDTFDRWNMVVNNTQGMEHLHHVSRGLIATLIRPALSEPLVA